MKTVNEVRPLLFKPDMPEAAKRFEAFYNGDIIKRPLTQVFAKKNGCEKSPVFSSRYTDRYFGDIDELIDKVLASSEGIYYGGEAVPAFCPTLGPDEMAVFCGGEFIWNPYDADTNWSKPCVDDWESFLPFKIDEKNEAYMRFKSLYERCAEKMAGKMLLTPIDLHSNMDLLAAARGPERLCADIMDAPELISEAMVSARKIFKEIWDTAAKIGRMDENGYCQGIYSHDGAACLQCDFAIMIGPKHFNRWVVPALEEESEIVRHAVYHWDGVDALRHFDAVMDCKGLQVISFVPGAGAGPRETGSHIEFLEIFKKMQKRGKAVAVGGTPDEIKIMHRELDPAKTIYGTSVETQDDADQFLEWMEKNT